MICLRKLRRESMAHSQISVLIKCQSSCKYGEVISRWNDVRDDDCGLPSYDNIYLDIKYLFKLNLYELV